MTGAKMTKEEERALVALLQAENTRLRRKLAKAKTRERHLLKIGRWLDDAIAEQLQAIAEEKGGRAA